MGAQAIPQPRKAEKRRVKLKIGIQGPSGSGKTDGALSLAKNLVPNGKFLVIDTENESASLYADRFEFDTIPLTAPYTSSRYEACIDAAVRGGYDVCVIDGISPQWDGDGGILRRKEELDKRPGSNSFTNWATFTPEHTHFIEKIKQAPIHIIVTMRSKTEYILQQNDRGKQMPKKVGTAPIQRDGFEYEFSLVLDVQMDHRAVAIKDRTTLFGDETIDLRNEDFAIALRSWLDSAKPEEPGSQPSRIDEPRFDPKDDLKPVPSVAARQALNPVPDSQPQPQRRSDGKTITEMQQKRFYAIAKGNNLSKSEMLDIVHKAGFSSIAEITMTKYEDICEALKQSREPEPQEVTDDDIPF